MAIIKRLQVENFKTLRNASVDLERFTVIVGPNATGKTNILQSLQYVSNVAHKNDASNIRIIDKGRTWGIANPVVIHVVFEDFGLLFTPSGSFRGNSGYWFETQGVKIGIIQNLSQTLRDTLPVAMHIQFQSSNLKDNHSSRDELTANGFGLHAATMSMALYEQSRWQALQRDLRKIVPDVREVRHQRVKQNQVSPLLFDFVSGAKGLTAEEVSEGTLIVLGLLTILHSSSRPKLILIDDIDRALHPKAQLEVIALLRRFLEQDPNLQIVATTHSPYLLDGLRPEEIRVTYLNSNRETVCAPLTRHAQYEQWKDEMAPGEMWSHFGEKWVLEAGVAS